MLLDEGRALIVDGGTVRIATEADLPALAGLIAAANRDPATQCLHSETGGSEQAVYREMASLHAAGELCAVLAAEGGRLVGALGSEVDEGAGRGWLRGPFVVGGARPWQATATLLLDGLLACLPAAIRRLDSFLNEANERGNAFYLAHGFRRVRLVHVYAVPAPAGGSPGAAPLPTEVHPLAARAGEAPAFAALHDATFPTTWTTGEGILARLGSEYHVLVHARGGQVLGYLVAGLEVGSGEGLVHFVGVRPDARRQGIGRGLLQTALHWFFAVKGVPWVNLTVDDDHANARSLYESVGLALRYTGLHTRRDL